MKPTHAVLQTKLLLPMAAAQGSRPHSPTTSMQTNPTSVGQLPPTWTAGQPLLLPNPLSPGSSKLSSSFTPHEILQNPMSTGLNIAGGKRADGAQTLTMPPLSRANTLATSTVMEGGGSSRSPGGYVEGMKDLHINGPEPRVWPGVISRRQASASEKDGPIRESSRESKPGSAAGGPAGA